MLLQVCRIVDCGELAPGQDDGYNTDDGTGDKYADWPEDSGVKFDTEEDTIKVIAIVGEIKDIGNKLYKEKSYEKAKQKYTKAMRYIEKLEDDADLTDEQEKELKEKHKLSIHLNIAACKLPLKDYEGTVEDCDKALDIAPGNIKALFRKGQAQVYLKAWEKAQDTLTKAANLDPEDKVIQKELVKVKAAMEQEKKKEKQMYQRMFAAS
ncbi:hypothetical protein DPMN_100765 [Dreissena polymorpha]|uniref:peptidylprolyl isomerase n=1 Tax=Dreissena polymorpha TaxID=45954 RepID=A0A9D4LHI0_DREPO|nr:hypothetical protein DPMN_100765 [Dreissena polymorpha]